MLAASESGGLPHAPDTYPEKLCVGPVAAEHDDIRWTPAENVRAIALALGRSVEDITVVILDRERHGMLIDEVREAGARIKLIGDGDLSAAISCAVQVTGVHAVVGIGGAPEGVITAAALSCLGGKIQGRFRFRSDEERARATEMGMDTDEDRVYETDDLAPGDQLIFSATGVTDGELLSGVRFFGGGARTLAGDGQASRAGPFRRHRQDVRPRPPTGGASVGPSSWLRDAWRRSTCRPYRDLRLTDTPAAEPHHALSTTLADMSTV